MNKQFSKVADFKIIIQKIVSFLYTKNKLFEIEIKAII